MKIDGTPVIPGSARYFRSLSGGYGIKMRIVADEGEPEFLFGECESKEAAEKSVKMLNVRESGDVFSGHYCPVYLPPL